MFESAELDHTIDKATYRQEEPKLREGLLDAQFDLAQQGRFSVVVLMGGVPAAGKGETVNCLNRWLDPRLVQTHAFDEPTAEERQRPAMWRFWQVLPPRGKIGIYFGAWITDRAGRIRRGRLGEVDEIVRFERMLADEGTLVLKFWLHLSKKRLKRRLDRLSSDPATRWRVTDDDWDYLRDYRKLTGLAEGYLRETSTAEAPWIIVEGSDDRYRNLTVGRTLLAALRERLDRPEAASPAEPAPVVSTPPAALDGKTVLAALDYALHLPRADYRKELERWQGRLNELSRDPKFRKHSVVAVFEGPDAAGKGGSIRRVTAALDARLVRVIPIAAPTDEERARPYLWRFWRNIPRTGHFALFDRSWYGRVLVERVERLTPERDWMRGYSEINDFEHQLAEGGAIVVKLWLAITPEEQLKRFESRERTSFKRFKITEEDWRNRDKWHAYEQAVCDLVDRTSTEIAPWNLIPANDKPYARIQVLKTICQRIEAALAR
jgi:polyphosphate:AMP phosphotransferase